jgi:hypothetical protein
MGHRARSISIGISAAYELGVKRGDVFAAAMTKRKPCFGRG